MSSGLGHAKEDLRIRELNLLKDKVMEHVHGKSIQYALRYLKKSTTYIPPKSIIFNSLLKHLYSH